MNTPLVRRVALVLAVVSSVALTAAASALAGRNLAVGVNEDAVKAREAISSVANALGLGYYRVTQRWQPGQAKPSPSDTASLDATVRNAGSQKILLSVFGSASAAPHTASERAAYCTFVSSVLDRYPQIAAVNVWKEANPSYFWKPASTAGRVSSPRVADLEAIGITTADQAASLRFYGLLGVEVPDAGEDHVEASVRGGLSLMWDTEELIRQIEPDLPSPVRQRIVLAFRCTDAADVDATYARVVAAGFEGKTQPWDAFWGQRFAYLRDPDGNTVGLFAPLG